MSVRGRRRACALGAAAGIALAASLPPTAPGWLFWGATAVACLLAAAWAALDARETED